MNQFKQLCFLVLLICCSFYAVAQNAVNVTVVIKPPYTAYIDNYRHLDNKAVITVTNLTGIQQQIYFKGKLENQSIGLYIRSSGNYRSTTPVVLQPNQTRVITADANAMRFLDQGNAETNADNKTKQNIVHTGQLPEGIYRICLQAFDFNTGKPLSDENSGCTSINITLAGPPQITYPMKGQEIDETQKNLNFSWTPPVGNLAGGHPEYELVVAKVMPGQNPNDAIIAAREYDAGNPLLHRKKINTQAYVTQPFDLKAEPGTTYAVQVVARDANNKLVFLNEGRSEIVVFYYKKKDKPHEPVVDKDNIPKGKVAMMDYYTIKGKLVWGFRKTEDGTSVVNNKAQAGEPNFSDVGFNDFSEGNIGAGLFGNSGNQGKSTGKNNTGSNFGVFGGGTSTGSFDYGGQQMGNIGMAPQTNKLEAEYKTKQKFIDNIVADKKYPLAYTTVKLYKRLDPALADKILASQGPDWGNGGNKKDSKIPLEVLLATKTTDANGNFQFDYVGDLGLGYIFQVDVASGYFQYGKPALPMNIQKNVPADLGSITGVANTYRSKITVTSSAGKPVSNVSVKILRVNGFYENPKSNINLIRELGQQVNDNGSRNKSKDDNSQYHISAKYEIIATGKPGSKFYKVFFNHGLSDRYLISITGEGFQDYLSDYSVTSPSDELSEDILDMERNYVLALANPVVTGHVVSTKVNIAIKGATVILHPKDMDYETAMANGKAMTAKTGSDGKFKIEDIPVSSKPYNITVLYEGQPYADDKDIFLNEKGIVYHRDPLEINIALLTVCGNVVNTHSKPLANATLHWKTGSKNFYSDELGNFFSMQTPGKHVLVAQKPGFKDAEIAIEVKPADMNVYLSSITNDPTKGFKYFDENVDKVYKTYNPGNADAGNKNLSVNLNIYGSPAGTLANGMTNTQQLFQNTVKSGDFFAASSSCGHTIMMKAFYVKVMVKDAAIKKPIEKAQVQAMDGKTWIPTNAAGVAILEDVPTGKVNIVTQGPANSFYTTENNVMTVNAALDTTVVTVSLKAGSKAKGSVMMAGKPMENAEVYVVGKEYITTNTDKSGNYNLNGVPVGDYVVRAAKEGLIAGEKQNTFEANKSYDINLELKDPGFNASSLLGFKMELTSSKPGTAPNEFIITGKLIKIPDNSVFVKDANNNNLKISFYEKTIIKSGNTIYPKDAEMNLTGAEIPLTVFDNFKGTFGSTLKLRAKGSDKTKGEIIGAFKLKLKEAFASLSDWSLPADAVSLVNGKDANIAAITSDGSAPTSFNLNGNGNGWSLYGFTFTPDFAGSSLDAKGLNMKGKVTISGIPAVSDISLGIESFKISKNGEITKLSMSTIPKPVIKLANTWNLDLNGINFDQYGITVAGDTKLPIPESAVSGITFSKLNISKNGLTGGNFYVPSGGLDIFGVTSFKTKDPISLQSLPGGAGFKVTGGGTFKLSKYIGEDIILDNFSFATSGDFSVTSKAGFTTDFDGLAAITLKNITIGNKLLDVDAMIKLDIPALGASVGSHIKYAKGGNVDVDKMHLGFDLAGSIGLNVDVSFLNEGFSGDGSLSLMGADGIGLQFHYLKSGNGKDIGAKFTAPASLAVPIVLVKWDKITGHFNYDSGNEVYSIGGGGRFAFIADEAGLLTLSDADITVTSSNSSLIIDGSANLVAMNSWNVGSAKATIDFGKLQISCSAKFGSNFSLIKGVNAGADGSITVAASGGSDKYIYVGGATSVSIAHVFNSNCYIAGGWHVPPSVDANISTLPAKALHSDGRFYGGYFNAHTSIGLTEAEARKNPVGFKSIASISAWYGTESDITVIGNIKSGYYGFSYYQSWAAGAEADFLDLPVAGADISLAGSVDASYSTNSGWDISGKLSGSINAFVGCDGGCNGITWGGCFRPCKHVWCKICPLDDCNGKVCPIPCGAKICAKASVGIGYTSAGGFTFDPSFFE